MSDEPMAPLALGELYGPCRCQGRDCIDEAWVIWLTPGDYVKAKSSENPRLMAIETGKALCKGCSPRNVVSFDEYVAITSGR